MPSPTSSTVPVSRASTPVLAPRISCSSTETISSTLNAMTAPLDQLIPDVLQARADAGVVDPVLNADDQAAQDVGVDLLVEDRLDGHHGADVVLDPAPLLVGQGHGRADVDDQAPGLAVVQGAERQGDGREHVQAVVLVEHLEEAHKRVAGPALERP